MKRFICYLLISSLLICLLSGCKENDASNQSSADTDESVVSDTEDLADDYEIPRNIFQLRKVQKFTFYDETSGKTIPYCLILPKDYNEKNKYPVLLYLHGAGERGNGNYEQLRNGVGNMYHTAGKHLDTAIFVAPQCAANDWWNVHSGSNADYRGSLGAVWRLLTELSATYSSDKDRYYVMGYSMGGFGTWEMIGNFKDAFAAAIPICGWWEPSRAAVIKDIPTWIYHGTDDPTVSYQQSKSMYDALIAAGGDKVKFKTLQGVGHNAWDYTAVDAALYDWLFAQHK